MNIGIAGVGKMGAAIAARLMEVGNQMTVWNRSPEKTKPLADVGAKIAATPADLAKAVDAVITILTDAAAINATYGGPSGLLAAELKGRLFIDMSTVQPQTEIALAEKLRAKGAAFIECPVGGTTGPARQGKLFGLVGGSDADLARAKPMLEQLCRRIEHCGDIGAGASMKLAINLPMLVSWQAFGEAFAISRHLGIDPARLVDIFSDSGGGTNALKGRAAVVAQMLRGDDTAPGTYDLASCRKDLATMLAEAKTRGVELPLVERAFACFDESNKEGWGARDSSSQAIYWTRRGMKSPGRSTAP
jgi:3-hydroxyisobutyrate dehydrogenase